jgi:hypothetical protein
MPEEDEDVPDPEDDLDMDEEAHERAREVAFRAGVYMFMLREERREVVREVARIEDTDDAQKEELDEAKKELIELDAKLGVNSRGFALPQEPPLPALSPTERALLPLSRTLERALLSPGDEALFRAVALEAVACTAKGCVRTFVKLRSAVERYNPWGTPAGAAAVTLVLSTDPAVVGRPTSGRAMPAAVLVAAYVEAVKAAREVAEEACAAEVRVRGGTQRSANVAEAAELVLLIARFRRREAAAAQNSTHTSMRPVANVLEDRKLVSDLADLHFAVRTGCAELGSAAIAALHVSLEGAETKDSDGPEEETEPEQSTRKRKRAPRAAPKNMPNRTARSATQEIEASEIAAAIESALTLVKRITSSRGGVVRSIVHTYQRHQPVSEADAEKAEEKLGGKLRAETISTALKSATKTVADLIKKAQATAAHAGPRPPQVAGQLITNGAALKTDISRAFARETTKILAAVGKI